MFETRCSWILKETSKNDSLTSPRPAWPVLQCLYLRLPASLNWDLSWAKYKLELRYVALNLAKPLNSMLCQRLGNHCGLVDYVLKPSFELVTCSCCSLNRRHLAAAPSKGHGDESRLNALNIHMWNVFWLRVKSETARTLVAQTCQQSWKKMGLRTGLPSIYKSRLHSQLCLLEDLLHFTCLRGMLTNDMVIPPPQQHQNESI